MSKIKQDRNFDKLVDKFEDKVYNTLKGEWRLKLLKEDLAFLQPEPSDVMEKSAETRKSDTKNTLKPLTIWDAGCGFAQISQWLAEAGHEVTLCDLSHQMLLRAQQNFADANLHATFIEGPAQEIATQIADMDVVLFHAVLEWLAAPQQTLETVAQKVKTGGHLSLLFYNRNAIVMSNALKGAWRIPFLLDDAYLGAGKKLTPPNPQMPEDVEKWLNDWGFEIKTTTGIRVFHDYMTPEVLEKTDEDDLMALEYRYCRQPTYRYMARYIHIVAKKL